jgi:hypothetical protein
LKTKEYDSFDMYDSCLRGKINKAPFNSTYERAIDL